MSDTPSGGLSAPALPPPTPPSWRERLDGIAADLDLTPRHLLLGVAALLVVATAAWWLLRTPAGPPPELTLPVATTGSGASPVTTTGEIVVHAAGAVRRPGVYTLAPGSRIGDLLDAAGGLAPGADAERLNLAGPLSDGSRVYVPRIGQAEVPVAIGEEPAAGPSGANASGEVTGPVNVNTADAAELETLPGIGPATAAAIIEHREEHGPFATVEDLLDVRGIGDARLADIRDLVTL